MFSMSWDKKYLPNIECVKSVCCEEARVVF